MAGPARKQARTVPQDVFETMCAGGTGVGKSTALLGLTGDRKFVPGKSRKGVTKNIIEAVIDNASKTREIRVRDVPGLGDLEIKAGDLFKMFDENLKGKDLGALLLFVDVTNPRFDLTAQFLVPLMNVSFPSKGKEKWDNFVLVGTKANLATELQRKEFLDLDAEDSFPNLMKTVVPDANVGHVCLVSDTDLKPLDDILDKLSSEGKTVGAYKIPDAKAVAQTFSKVLKIDEKDVLDSWATTMPAWAEQLIKDGDKKDQHIQQLMKTMLELKNQPAQVHERVVHVPGPPCAVM